MGIDPVSPCDRGHIFAGLGCNVDEGASSAAAYIAIDLDVVNFANLRDKARSETAHQSFAFDVSCRAAMRQRCILPLMVIIQGGKFELIIHAGQVAPGSFLFGSARLMGVTGPTPRDRNPVPIIKVDNPFEELDEINGNGLLEDHNHFPGWERMCPTPG